MRESTLLEVRKSTVEGGGIGELFWRRRGYGCRHSVRRASVKNGFGDVSRDQIVTHLGYSKILWLEFREWIREELWIEVRRSIRWLLE